MSELGVPRRLSEAVEQIAEAREDGDSPWSAVRAELEERKQRQADANRMAGVDANNAAFRGPTACDSSEDGGFDAAVKRVGADRLADLETIVADHRRRQVVTNPYILAELEQRRKDAASSPDSLTITGAELAAYRKLQTAAAAAHADQQRMATSGAALREAIQGLCAVIAPGPKP